MSFKPLLKSFTRQGVFKQTLCLLSALRLVHTMPVIEHIDELQGKGISGLYSKEGLERAWFSRAQNHVNLLNKLSLADGSGSNLENIVRVFYKEPSKKQLYENASNLLNGKFAMETISGVSTTGTTEQLVNAAFNEKKYSVEDLLRTPLLEAEDTIENIPVDTKLKEWLEYSFGSILEFKTLLLNTAMGIKGDGYVWVVADNLNSAKERFESLYILNTFGCGQPNSKYATRLSQLEEHYNLQQKKEQEDGSDIENIYSAEQNLFKTVREAEETFHFTKKSFVPILAFDASPKSYLYDYGVFGKRAYLEQLWKSTDWDKVAQRLPERFIPVHRLT